MTYRILVAMFAVFCGACAYLFVFFKNHESLTLEQQQEIVRFWDPPSTTRGMSPMQTPPTFEAVAINLDWTQGAAILTILSILLGFIYWLVSAAVVGPMIEKALKQQMNEFRILLNDLVSQDTFNEFKEADARDHQLMHEEIRDLNDRIAERSL